MKYILILLLITSAYADQILKKTMGCPTVMALKKSPNDSDDNYLELNMYAIANNCVIISKRDKVEAIGYDSRNSKDIFQKIVYKKTGVMLYILSSSIMVEQGGKKDRIRF